jgi:GTPase involved in cell partitioning and DNA repair
VDASHPPEKLVESYGILRNEIGKFRPGFESRPFILVFSKMDLPGSRESADAAAALLNLPGRSVYYVSAVTGEGITSLLDGLVALRKTGFSDET